MKHAAKKQWNHNHDNQSCCSNYHQMLNNILQILSNGSSFSQLVEPLSNAVAELKNVASGIIEHQKAKQTDKSAASARISNNYGQLSSIFFISLNIFFFLINSEF